MAALDEDHRLHRRIQDILEDAPSPLLLSPFVLAELDYLILTRVGGRQERSLLSEVARGSYRLEPFSAADVAEALAVIEHYADFGSLGLADASLVVLANRHGTLNILTLDERRFRTVSGPGGPPFRILPADF